MNQGRRKQQERDAYLFCGMCLVALVMLVGLALAGSDGVWFPWGNLAGVALILGAVKVAGGFKP